MTDQPRSTATTLPQKQNQESNKISPDPMKGPVGSWLIELAKTLSPQELEEINRHPLKLLEQMKRNGGPANKQLEEARGKRSSFKFICAHAPTGGLKGQSPSHLKTD